MRRMARRAKTAPALKIVFDTNALFTKHAHYLVSHELRELIEANSAHPDVAISWHLPEVVVQERTHQMRQRASQLIPGIQNLEKLLGNGTGLDEEILHAKVDLAVQREIEALGLTITPVDHSKVDWSRICKQAAFRLPPFDGDQEGKGFRDAVILETLLQMIDASPVTASVCRIALVSGDGPLSRAAAARTAGMKNVRILKGLEELKGLINTIVSEVPEDVVERLGQQATSMFFSKDVKTSLFYKEDLWGKARDLFPTSIREPPFGSTSVRITSLLISEASFVRKQGRRVSWTNHMTYGLEASKQVMRSPPTNALANLFTDPKSLGTVGSPPQNTGLFGLAQPVNSLLGGLETIVTNTGEGVIEVEWSASLSANEKLSAPRIEEIREASTPWQMTKDTAAPQPPQ